MIDLYNALPPQARPLLTRPRLAYVGITSKKGPHVTPELFVHFGGRFWIATARRTLKARTLSTGTPIGFLVKYGARSLIVEGDVGKFDPLDPIDALAAAPDAHLVLPAMASFTLRNARHLAGLFADPKSLPHSPSTLRVPLAIRPRRAVLLEGWRVAATMGTWDERRAVPTGPHRDGDTGDLPNRFERLTEGVATAVLGWEHGETSLPLPALWDESSAGASVSAELMARIGAAPAARACVALERKAGERIDDKEGVLLRGEATVRANGIVAEAAIEVDRATRWEGVETETVSA